MKPVRTHQLLLLSLLLLNLCMGSEGKDSEINEMARHIAEDTALDIQCAIQSQYDCTDKSPLLVRKESLDSHILSLFLLNELGESSQCEWCRLIRYDYTGAGGCNYVVATPTGLQSLKRSFDGFDLI